jgi:hypothetical protein
MSGRPQSRLFAHAALVVPGAHRGYLRPQIGIAADQMRLRNYILRRSSPATPNGCV